MLRNPARMGALLLSTALLIAIGYTSTGCSGNTESSRSKSNTPWTSADKAPIIAQGKAMYGKYCALCHGENGEGYVADNAPQLNNQQYLSVASLTFLENSIAMGRTGTPMAAYSSTYGGPLPEDSVRALTWFIKSWQTVPDNLPKKEFEFTREIMFGQLSYEKRCQQCHGEEGQRGLYTSLGNGVFLHTVSNHLMKETITNGRPGTPMPAYKDSLSEGEIDQIVTYIRNWAYKEGHKMDKKATATPGLPEEVVMNPDGREPTWDQWRNQRFIAAEEVAREIDLGRRMVILDARATSDFVLYHIPGAVPSPYYNLEPIAARLPEDKDTWILAYCACPHKASGKAIDFMRERGYKNSAIIDEGILHWHDQGYPLETGLGAGGAKQQ